jgi:hypothetical protein
MMDRGEIVSALVSLIADYRQGEITARTPDDVERWVGQFSRDVQLPMLLEMKHVLEKTYFSRKRVIGFLKGVMHTKKLVGDDPNQFWASAQLLNIQGGGGSQKSMNVLFRSLLKHELGIELDNTLANPFTYVYLDDGIYTGNRVLNDVKGWITNAAPANATLHIIANAVHRGGEFYANTRIKGAIKESGKKIETTLWHAIYLEDRKVYTNNSDVLRPTSLPDDALVKSYVDGMSHKPNFRQAGQVGGLGIFSNDQGRQLLEQEFLKAGAYIRSKCPGLGVTQRPLGHMTLETLGFGSLVVTFRNCPNNAPLALWAGQPWIPLFPRVTNNDTAVKRLMENLAKDFA